MPVSVVGVKISKTGNYTILFTVSGRSFPHSILFTVSGVTKYQIDLYSVVAMFQIPEALTRHGLAV
ncbi:hypothetical protein EGX44_00035 (plasmid) [Yersinia pseudotuberculosis]|nr:hypothetical protein EGX44_00035 [Yersinia pseudotuberculosis]